jgi:2-C-methyl-D-erythritol 4-phosphate cytidylyltransferase
MGSDVPKPFIELVGKSILQRTIECFLKTEGLAMVIVVTSEDKFADCAQILDDIQGNGIDLKVVKGGAERQYSIWNAIRELPNNIELVAIHDAVRPFVKTEYIDKCFEAAAEFGGAVLSVPVKDTIKKINEDHLVVETPERSKLWQAQTPQVFRKDVIFKAYELAIKNSFLGTDDSSLVERMGETIKVIEGGRENLKITFPIDLKVAELIINEGL